jgi:biopolymer transport protein ExbD
MAGIAVDGGGGRGRKALDAELNMVPMIDLLMVTIAFLLVTAVWSHMSRLEGSAKAPGAESVDPPRAAKALHVDMRLPDKYLLTWREGQVVIRSIEVPHDTGALAKAIGQEYRSSGVHTAPTDVDHDQAVLHTANDAPFSEMVAVMDAIAATRRPLLRGESAAFALTLATQ